MVLRIPLDPPSFFLDCVVGVCKAAPFLPLEANGVRVLVEEQPNVWRVTNDQLQATTAGLGYRKSKNLDDRFSNNWLANWNDFIDGIDDGDGWVRCGRKARAHVRMIYYIRYEY